MMDMHHIIGDAMTAALLLRRLNALYLGENTSVPYLQYTDYAYWFHNKEGAAADKAYWTGQMQEILGLPEIPSTIQNINPLILEGRNTPTASVWRRAISATFTAVNMS